MLCSPFSSVVPIYVWVLCGQSSCRLAPHSVLHVIHYHFNSLSTAGVASVNSACPCVHLPYGGMLCDPVGCELVQYMWNTVSLFSAHCTTGNTANVKEEQDKSKFNSLYHLHHACCSENVFKKHNMGVAYSWTLHNSISLQKYLAKMTTSAWLLQFQGSLNSLVVWLRNSKTQLSSINPLTIPTSFKGLISTDTCQQANLYQFIGNHPVQDWIIASR